MRPVLLAALLGALLATPALGAKASDPLLSGYGGPGDGEQALLGQTLLLSSGDGAPAAATPAPDAIYEEPPPAAEAPAASGEPATRPARRPPRPARRPAAEKPEPAPAPPTAQPRPTSVVGTGGTVSAPAPFDGRDALLLGAVALLLAALAGAARRLAVRAARARRPSVLQPR